MNPKNKTALYAYLGIFFIVLFWGLMPPIKKAMIGDSFSASIYMVITTFSASFALLGLSARSLKQLNGSYFKIAIPTGLCVGAGALSQALAYNFGSSPVNQAFLENLSCVIVPVILFFLIKKKPSLLTLTACVLCLLSSAVLTGIFQNGTGFCTADILNVLAGVFYGINIALTGIYAKKFIASLYVMIQLFTQSFFSLGMAVAFGVIRIGGAPIDAFVFTPNMWLIAALAGIGIMTNAVCWTVRTAAMKHVSPTVVAVIMPLSAVVTSLFAVIMGQDTFSLSLLIGAVLGIAASIVSGIGDVEKKS